MEREGVITGTTRASIRRRWARTCWCSWKSLSAKSGDVFDKVKQELLYVPEVMECHLVSGEFDYLVKARLSEMNEYRRLLGEILKRCRFRRIHSYIVMEEIKESLYLPVDR